MRQALILVVDDEREQNETLIRGLKELKVEGDFLSAADEAGATKIVNEKNPDVAIIDLSLNPAQGVESGFSLLQSITTLSPHTRVIVLTGNSGNEYGIRALQQGAAHFIAKPASLEHLTALIRDAIYQSHLRASLAQHNEERASELQKGFVGESHHAKKLRQEIESAARTSQAIFIRGETGTGKGLCARLIHQLSNRRQFAFVRYQPLFASSDLVNSDLFGHRKGAFTGAIDDREGLLSTADRGTLFLDEIDELPNETQVMFLGVLQDKRFRRLGDNKEQQANFRLISASNAALAAKVEAGTLRRDLFHRIAHEEILIAPLRERIDDIALLAQHSIELLRFRESLPPFSLGRSALRKLESYQWPGNVRELESVIEGALWRALQRESRELSEADIRFLSDSSDQHLGGALSFNERVSAFERNLISKALQQHNNSISAVARALGIDRGTVKRISQKV